MDKLVMISLTIMSYLLKLNHILWSKYLKKKRCLIIIKSWTPIRYFEILKTLLLSVLQHRGSESNIEFLLSMILHTTSLLWKKLWQLLFQTITVLKSKLQWMAKKLLIKFCSNLKIWQTMAEDQSLNLFFLISICLS
jgi:hypothetical protein